MALKTKTRLGLKTETNKNLFIARQLLIIAWAAFAAVWLGRSLLVILAWWWLASSQQLRFNAVCNI